MPALPRQDRKVWRKTFQELIQQVKPSDQWTLTLDENLAPNVLQPGWTQYQQWVFARFKCSCCSRSWASAKVQVLFHMYWSKKGSEGQVKMRVFGQRCNTCSPDSFEVPEFTEENISRILNNLVFRILKKCYKEGFKSMEETPTVQDISLEGPHDTDNCEACLRGFCTKSGLDPAKPSPVSPLLPTISSSTVTVPIYKPPAPSSSTKVNAVTGDSRVKEEKVLPNPWLSKPPQAKRPGVHTNYGVEPPQAEKPGVHTNYRIEPPQAEKPGVHTNYRIEPPQAERPGVHTSYRVEPPQAEKPRVHTNYRIEPPQVERPRVHTNYRVEPPQAKRPRVHTKYHVDTVIQVPPPREFVGSRWRCNSKICCCLAILVLIIAVVVIVVKII